MQQKGGTDATPAEQWQRGDRVSVEAVLARFPHLADDDNAVLDLIYNEVVLREAAGEKPALADYVGRFPRLADQLRLQFEVDQALTRLPEYDAAIRAYAQDRGDQLSEDHDRVKFATRGEGATTEVEAVLPADVIGLYVLVPEAN